MHCVSSCAFIVVVSMLTCIDCYHYYFCLTTRFLSSVICFTQGVSLADIPWAGHTGYVRYRQVGLVVTGSTGMFPKIVFFPDLEMRLKDGLYKGNL